MSVAAIVRFVSSVNQQQSRAVILCFISSHVKMRPVQVRSVEVKPRTRKLSSQTFTQVMSVERDYCSALANRETEQLLRRRSREALAFALVPHRHAEWYC